MKMYLPCSHWITSLGSFIVSVGLDFLKNYVLVFFEKIICLVFYKTDKYISFT